MCIRDRAKPPHTWNIEFSFLLSLFKPSKTLYFLSLSGTKLGQFWPNIYYSREEDEPNKKWSFFSIPDFLTGANARDLNKPWPKTGHDIAENRTLFIRNLSFDSDEQDLRDMMQENFGKVLFARLVLDKMTEMPKGTAFIKFQVRT